jgi:hypothetical protein
MGCLVITYDYLRASSSSIIGATWNKIVHDGV